MAFHFEHQGKTLAKSESEKIECIQKKHDQLYGENPIQFAIDAYFDCIQSLKERTHGVVESIFGPNHPYLEKLFRGENDLSLYKIRAGIVHGRLKRLNKDHSHLVGTHVHEIEQISREFLVRIILGLKPEDSLPSWSRVHLASMSTADPRSTMVASTDEIFPNKDWRIRAEWCE